MTYDNNNDATLTGSLDNGVTPHATFTGQITTTVLTVTGSVTNTIHVGDWIFGTGVAVSQKIISFGSGSGGIGTYNLATSQATTGTVSMTAATPGNMLTVTDTPSVGTARQSGSLDIGTNVVSSRNPVDHRDLNRAGHGGHVHGGRLRRGPAIRRAIVAPIGIFAGSWAAGTPRFARP